MVVLVTGITVDSGLFDEGNEKIWEMRSFQVKVPFAKKHGVMREV